MASKEVKNALKAAREAIRNKDFKEALKQCKIALAEDKNNYNALVFVGVAAEGLEQYEQALKAYRRATDVSPEQLLAWQGLSTMHTKNPGQIPQEEMVGVYEKLIELNENDKEKQQDAIVKLIPLYGNSDIEKTLGLYERLNKDTLDASGKDLLLRLITLLRKQPQLTPNQEAKLLSSLQEYLFTAKGNDPDPTLEGHVQSYLQLVQKREPERVLEESSKLAESFPTFLLPLETKLRLLLDRQMDNSKAEEVEEIRKAVPSLKELAKGESTTVFLLAEGYLSLLDGKYTAAKDLLEQSVSKMSSCFCGQFYLAQALFKLHANITCVQVCERALKLVSSKTRVVSVSTITAAQRLRLFAVRSCLLQCSRVSLIQALTYLDELKEATEEADVLRAYVCLELGEQEQIQSCLEKLTEIQTVEVRALKAWVDFHSQDYTSAVSKLQQCVSEDSTNAEFLLKLGCALWEQRHDGSTVQEQCFNTLLKAAKLDPYLSGTFLYLGHFYSQLKKDQQRAKKCYQKAYDLDPSNEEAGAAICDMMAVLGEEENVQSLLHKVTDSASAGCAKWAWLRLGLAQMRTEDPSTAAVSFQSALRADPDDRHVWECLAEAYLHRGSFTAALKAFEKAVELHPDSTYSLYQMANIKQRLGVLTEAADEYRNILDKSADYVPALKGLGETYLMLAQRYLSQYLVGLAKDTCQRAITCLTRAATQRPDLSCLWKLMGDCCTVLHPLHSQSFRIPVLRRLCQTTSKDNTEMVEISKEELLELGTKCYGRAVKILPDSPALWHDLGIGFFHLCKEKSCGADQKSLADKCVHALKKALSLDPNNYMHWTALGVVAASPYVKNMSLAQHCFIKSVQNETKNAVAWTNLGALYLQHENIQLAHQAFKVAQSQEPEYMASWIGQALVAEVVGHEEAMDLFRHTTELGIHMESCLGYGHWVISTLLDVERQDTEAFQYCIKQMAAIPAAADALTRYTVVMKDDPCAFNMLGLLLEHQDLNKSALKAFQRAAELAEQSGAAQDAVTKIQLNLARLLSKNQMYAEAARVYKLCAASVSFADLCQWGLMLYKSGQLQDSYKVYQQALSMAETDSDKSDVCAAMGMVAFKSGNMDDAKAALFQGFQLSTPSLQGLFALCALGLLQGDLTLTQATLQELSGMVKSGDTLSDVAVLTAALKLQQGEGSEAMNSVEQLLADNSEVVGLYLLMSRLALQHNSGYTAESSATLALTNGGSNDKDALLSLAMSQLYIGKHSRQQPSEDPIRTAQKAFHSRPDDVSVLCCLASAVHGEGVIQYITKGNSGLLSQELHLLDLALTSPKVTAAQKCWCLKQKAITCLLVDNSDGAGQTLQQLLCEFPEEEEMASVLQCVVAGDRSKLEPLVIREGSELFFWQILLCELMKEKRWTEAGLLLREVLQKASSHSGHVVKIVCLVSIAWLAAQQLWVECSDDGSGDSSIAVSELEEACEAVGQLSDQPYTLLQVLQAFVYMDGNSRKAKHHFANALETGHMSSCLGLEVSLARRGIIFLLHNSSKDKELIQQLVSEADSSGDVATVELHQRLSKS